MESRTYQRMMRCSRSAFFTATLLIAVKGLAVVATGGLCALEIGEGGHYGINSVAYTAAMFLDLM